MWQSLGFQRAYVLHRRPYKENQCIVELLCEQEGKLSVFTYLSSKDKIKSALLQPFQLLAVELQLRNDHYTIKQIESIHQKHQLTGNYLYSGFYINELFVRLLIESNQGSDLFPIYHHSLLQLQHQQPIEPLLRTLEIQLLTELGIAPDFSVVFEQDSPYFTFDLEQGFVATDSVSSASFSRSDLQAIAQQLTLTPPQQLTFKRLTRRIFNELLGGKPLKSRELFN
jgi:DNA repair protein RecO (recombination protein O)